MIALKSKLSTDDGLGSIYFLCYYTLFILCMNYCLYTSDMYAIKNLCIHQINNTMYFLSVLTFDISLAPVYANTVKTLSCAPKDNPEDRILLFAKKRDLK